MLTDADERLAHQIPEPLPAVAGPDRHWRESYFFAAHHPERLGDALVLTMAANPARRAMDSYQMGRLDGQLFFSRTSRPFGDDPHTPVAGPVSVEIVRPYQQIVLRAGPGARGFGGTELIWTARTRPYLTRRGTLVVDGAPVWDQRQVMQSGWFDGEYVSSGRTVAVERWWGQRDHSWGIRRHPRCPLWIWLAVQLPDGMLGAWLWEHADGRRHYLDGCWAPDGGEEPVPLADLRYDLDWLDAAGEPVRGTGAAQRADGLGGRVVFVLSDGRSVTVDGRGHWIAPYGRRGGGLHQVSVHTSDGRDGTAIYEVTGCAHHRFFPEGAS
ncbi:hypothetical protein [Amycolatopsis rubida]|uniref:Hydroxyneurosporene synthase (CrtC) n=1 Tax=Amycolatopsis rubida TaxID=112413 RepID=A0A1I5S781_9PSEU|nr:hypothetical protein [Amycolatopsis rubida]SFP66579.1 hypothetical protein SAMN05421854_106216 [Amycolatopsis rubida]